MLSGLPRSQFARDAPLSSWECTKQGDLTALSRLLFGAFVDGRAACGGAIEGDNDAIKAGGGTYAATSGVLRGVGLEPAGGLFCCRGKLGDVPFGGEVTPGEPETTTSGTQSWLERLWIRRDVGRLFFRESEGVSDASVAPGSWG